MHAAQQCARCAIPCCTILLHYITDSVRDHSLIWYTILHTTTACHIAPHIIITSLFVTPFLVPPHLIFHSTSFLVTADSAFSTSTLISGPLPEINSAISKILYTPHTNFYGNNSLKFTVFKKYETSRIKSKNYLIVPLNVHPVFDTPILTVSERELVSCILSFWNFNERKTVFCSFFFVISFHSYEIYLIIKYLIDR